MTNNLNIENALVLIVDDVPENIQVLGSIIRANKFQVAFATSGIQAIRIAEVKKPDLIMLDITMPEMDGFEVCKNLKSNPETQAIPIIFLTARADIEDIIKGFEVGAIDYVTKPFNSHELIARVKTHIELKKSREITQAQKIELEQINCELKAENEAKDKFFSIMAHDLKSPFAGMIGIAEVLFDKNNKLSETDFYQLGEVLSTSIQQQYKLFEELLEWGKLRIRKSKHTLEPFELLDAIFGVEAILQPMLLKKDITFSHNIPVDAVLYGDINLIATVIRNLVSNSIKFTPRNGSICIDYKDIGDRALISVKDSGIGMDEKTLKSLFHLDNIISNRGTDDEEGNGLGLIICKEIVEQTGGKLNVESEINKGSIFSFDLPKYGVPNE